MGNIKKAVCQTLATYLGTVVPTGVPCVALAADVEESTFINQAGTAIPASVRVLPLKFMFSSFQEVEIDDTSYADKLLIDVGLFEGTVEVRVSGSSNSQREVVSQAVLDGLMARENTARVTVLQTPAVVVGGVTWTYQAPCSFEIESEEWKNEYAFSKKRFQWIELGCRFPVLLSRTATYNMNSLFSAFTEDLTSALPTYEQVTVNADGSTNPA